MNILFLDPRYHCRNAIAYRSYTSSVNGNNNHQQVFDKKMLEYLVCPLSKTPLRLVSPCLLGYSVGCMCLLGYSVGCMCLLSYSVGCIGINDIQIM